MRRRQFLALTPAEAVRLYEESRGAPDIVVTDVIMPQMAGPDVAREIAAIHPDVVCVFMSGFTDAGGQSWQEINIQTLSQHPRFLSITAQSHS